MKVLLAEDDRRLGQATSRMLERSGVGCDWVKTGEEALENAGDEWYDVIVLDWMLPGKSGLEVCGELRRSGHAGAVLFLTARDEVEDRVAGLEAGADDYVVKPFAFAELLARIKALARRNYAPIADDLAPLGQAVLNRSERALIQGDQIVRLTGREFEVLDLLLRNRGKVLPKHLIMDRIWGLSADVTDNALDASLKLLRKKLKQVGEAGRLANVRGTGYRIE